MYGYIYKTTNIINITPLVKKQNLEEYIKQGYQPEKNLEKLQ